MVQIGDKIQILHDMYSSTIEVGSIYTVEEVNTYDNGDDGLILTLTGNGVWDYEWHCDEEAFKIIT